MSVFGHTQIKSNENVYTIQETDANIKKRMPAGTIIMYAGKSIPEGFLMCNGGAYSSSIYPELYAAIGTIYGNGEGGSNGEDFNVPDLTDAGDNGNLGRFVRAATTLDEVGTKEADAIRNITGNFTLAGPLNGAIAGDAFHLENQVKGAEGGLGPGMYWSDDGLGISTFGMNFVYYLGGHAGIETHPYSTKSLYLIAY